MCVDCTTDEGESDELINGLPQCEAGCFSCKHLEVNNHRHRLHGNPWHRVTAGGLRDALDCFGTVSLLSGRDALNLPTLDAMNYYSDSIKCTEKLFWKVMAQSLLSARNSAINRINSERAKQNG